MQDKFEVEVGLCLVFDVDGGLEAEVVRIWHRMQTVAALPPRLRHHLDF